MAKSNTGTSTSTCTSACIHTCEGTSTCTCIDRNIRCNRKRPRRSTILLTAIFLAICLLAFQQLKAAHFLFVSTHSRSQLQAQPSANNSQHPSIQLQQQVQQVQQLPQQPEQPEPQAHVPRRTDNDSTFSACLLVADDNHYLIEWLAFHYHTLPLRYLVITSDPRSRTTPDLILDRWDPYMTIVRWSDQNFLPPPWLNRIPPENDPIAKLTKHRERQRHFYPACFQFLKQAGRQWVMVIDVDEFVLHNTHYNGTRFAFDLQHTDSHSHSHMQHHNTSAAITVNATTDTGSVTPTILEAIQFYHPSANISCITIPRLRFGNFENNNATRARSRTNNKSNTSNLQKSTAPPGFHDNHFLTYRFRWHAALSSRRDNKPPKSTIHVGRISNFSRQDTDAHRPVRSACPRQHFYTLPQDSPFVVHHYVGTDQQFRFRNDARDGTKNRNDNQLQIYHQIRDGYDQSASTWITSFVQQMGHDTAQYLLEGVGDVEYSLHP